MDEFLIRVLLSFIVGGIWITFSIVIAEKLGNKIGGILISLPPTTLVSMFFIGWTKSPEFAAQAATLAPFGMIATGLFLFILLALMKKYGQQAFLFAFAAWFLTELVVETIGGKNMLVGVAVYTLLILVLVYVVEKRMDIKSMGGTQRKHTTRELAYKACFSGGIVALAIVVANAVGPWWGGIFATFPAATVSSMYILLREKGADFAMATGKVVLFASLNIIVYVAAISITYPTYGLIIGTVLSYIAAAVFAALLYFAMRKMK
jgi:hypothetical protein